MNIVKSSSRFTIVYWNHAWALEISYERVKIMLNPVRIKLIRDYS